MAIRAWAYFAWVQFVCLIAMVIGWVLLLPFCLLHWWQPMVSPKYTDGRVVTVWPFNWMQNIWGNYEDGVTGVGTTAGIYLPNAPDWWRAYMWSAWRNSCNNLRWVFRWYGKDGAPLFYRAWRGWYFKAGWLQDNGFITFNAGRL